MPSKDIEEFIIEILNDAGESPYVDHVAVKFRIVRKDDRLGQEYIYHEHKKDWHALKSTYTPDFPFLRIVSYIWEHALNYGITPIPESENHTLLKARRWADDHLHIPNKTEDLDRQLDRLFT